MAPAQELDGLLAGEVLHARLKVDVEVLRGVVIFHAERHLVVYAADGVHDGRDALEVHDNILIRLKAHQALDFDLGLLNALLGGVGRVDLAPRAAFAVVAHGIARNIHNVDGLVLGVHRRDHQGVRARLVLIDRADNEREHIFDARALIEQAARIDLVAVGLVVDGIRGRTHEEHVVRRACRAQKRDQHRQNDGDDTLFAALFRHGGLAALCGFCAFFALRLGRGLRCRRMIGCLFV